MSATAKPASEGTQSMSELNRTPFHSRHVALGAKMVDFGGWAMPVRYPAGIIAEHLATRSGAGLFDVSHMGRFTLRGPGALPFLQHVLTNNAEALDLLDEIPGVSCFRPEATFYVFPNVTGLMKAKGPSTYDELRRAALEQTGVSFCTRLHFGRALPGEAEAYARFAYSGIPVEEIREGLGKLKEWALT